MLGLKREAAARYSFLLAIPIIVLSSMLIVRDLLATDKAVEWATLGIGTVVATVSAFLCIHLFLKWINRISMLPFVIYRLLLGALLLLVFL